MIEIDMGATYDGMMWHEALEMAERLQKEYHLSDETINIILNRSKAERESND